MKSAFLFVCCSPNLNVLMKYFLSAAQNQYDTTRTRVMSCLTIVRVCLQEYVRLIGPWCQANVGSCRFVLGQAYLACGEGQKVKQRTVTSIRENNSYLIRHQEVELYLSCKVFQLQLSCVLSNCRRCSVSRRQHQRWRRRSF